MWSFSLPWQRRRRLPHRAAQLGACARDRELTDGEIELGSGEHVLGVGELDDRAEAGAEPRLGLLLVGHRRQHRLA